MFTDQNEEYILCIFEQGSISKAAAAFGITQPAVSLCINKLESQLGFKIFERKKSPVKPTPEGEIYIEYLKEKRLLAKDYKKRIQDITNDKNHSLTIGGSSVYIHSLLLNRILSFEEEMNNRGEHYNISFKEAPLSKLIEGTLNGNIDFFISTSDEVPAEIRTEKLISEKLFLCIPKSFEINKSIKKYAIKSKNEIHNFDYHLLDGQKFIFLEKDQPLQKELCAFLQKYEINPINSFTVNQASLASRLCMLEKGITLISGEILFNLERTDNLYIYSVPEEFGSRQLYISYHKDRYMSSGCSKLIKYIKNELEERK